MVGIDFYLDLGCRCLKRAVYHGAAHVAATKTVINYEGLIGPSGRW
jgi:hypothetical protein